MLRPPKHEENPWRESCVSCLLLRASRPAPVIFGSQSIVCAKQNVPCRRVCAGSLWSKTSLVHLWSLAGAPQCGAAFRAAADACDAVERGPRHARRCLVAFYASFVDFNFHRDFKNHTAQKKSTKRKYFINKSGLVYRQRCNA